MSAQGQSDTTTLTLCRSAQGRVRIVRPCIDQLPEEILEANPLGYNAVQHLAIALGCCMTEFAHRYLARRRLPQTCMTVLDWEMDGQRCQIARIGVSLRLALALAESELPTLHRMLSQCPVHQALSGNVLVEVDVRQLEEAELRIMEAASTPGTAMPPHAPFKPSGSLGPELPAENLGPGSAPAGPSA